MSTNKLNDLTQLPKELLTHIATYCDALSALRLSTTCRTIRSACYDKLVFKQIIARSSEPRWDAPLDKIEAAASRLQLPYDQTSADSFPSSQVQIQLWARYALADHYASLLMTLPSPPESMSSPRTWLPALAVLHHPIFQPLCTASYLRDSAGQSTGMAFCLATAILATEKPLPMLTKHMELQERSRIMHVSGGSKVYLLALCSAVLMIRSQTARQRAAWPYGAMARLPHVQFPAAATTLFSEAVAPPLPFVDESSWDSWYREHNRSLCSPDYFTTGTWCGYYTRFSSSMAHLDPPMLDINFEHFDTTMNKDTAIKLRATGCRDGVDYFSIFATVQPVDSSDGNARSTFIGRKLYGHHTTWMWDLEVTPFGLVGFWGSPAGRDMLGGESLRRNGMVWLWKQEWMQNRAG